MADGTVHSSVELMTGALATTLVGCIVAHDERGLVVDFPDNPGPPAAARTVIALDRDTVADAIASKRGVLLTFERGRPELPIVVGLLQDTPAPEVVEVDGQRVVIDGKDEIVLRCGAASITLRRNGRVVIRGTYVETRSVGVNRIRGGSVLIN